MNFAIVLCRLLPLCLLGSPTLLSGPAWAASWIASVDHREGLPAVSIGGATALSSNFVFWRKDWAWSGLSTNFNVLSTFSYTVDGKNQGLNFDLHARVNKTSERQLAWAFDLDARSATPDAIGGGMTFRFSLARFGDQLGEPELLPDNRGWAWGKAGGARMEMRFDPPLATVYFERGQKSEIRAYFYFREVPQGQRRYAATLTLSGGTTIGPTLP